MKRWLEMCLSVAMFARVAHAGDLALEITPPKPDWLMPPLICTNSSISVPVCIGSGLTPREAVHFGLPMQQQPEGLPTPGEEQLLRDISPLVAAGNYRAVIDRVRTSYGAELRLLEVGDGEGFLRTRMPTAGGPAAELPPAPERPRQTEPGLFMDRSRGPGNATRSVFPARPGNLPPMTISASLLYVVGHSYFSLQQYLPAETAFGLALRALPNHVRAHESLGLLYLRTERYAEAREQLGQAVELGRDTVELHTALGYLDQKTRHYWGATIAFQRALVLAPDDRNAQRGLLDALTETHEHAEAGALVEQLLRREPNDPGLWLHRAEIALSTGDRAAAVASLETALKLGDDSVANRRTLVALQVESGNVARAVDLLRGPVARGLAFEIVEQALGWLADADQWDRFRELAASVDRAGLGGVEQSRLLTRRASLAMHEGNRRAAGAALEEALALDPSNADALLALAQVYRGNHDYGHADLLLRRASAYLPVRENALLARAGLAIDRQDFDGALALLRSVVDGAPARLDVRRNVDLLHQLVLLHTQR